MLLPVGMIPYLLEVSRPLDPYVMQQRQEERLLLQWQMIQRLPRGGSRLH